MSIEGIPEGWEFVRVGKVKRGEFYVDRFGNQCEWVEDIQGAHSNYVVIRKIEKPKQYRAFANAAEFEPHRDRWLTHPVNTCEGCFLVVEYNDKGIFANGMEGLMPYKKAYGVGLRFSDGTPFGVEVTE